MGKKGEEWFRVSDSLHLTAVVGDDIGRSLLVATNEVSSCCEGGQRAAGNMITVILFS